MRELSQNPHHAFPLQYGWNLCTVISLISPAVPFPLLWNLIEVKGDLETSCLRRHRGREVTDGRLCGHNLDSDSTLWWSSSFLIYLKWLTVKTFNYILNISSPFYIPIFFIWKKKKTESFVKSNLQNRDKLFYNICSLYSFFIPINQGKFYVICKPN